MAVQSGPFRQESGHREADLPSMIISACDEDPVHLEVAARRKLVDLMPDVALGRKVLVKWAFCVGDAACLACVFHWLHNADLAVQPNDISTMVEASHFEEKEVLLTAELQVITPQVDFSVCLFHDGATAND